MHKSTFTVEGNAAGIKVVPDRRDYFSIPQEPGVCQPKRRFNALVRNDFGATSFQLWVQYRIGATETAWTDGQTVIVVPHATETFEFTIPGANDQWRLFGQGANTVNIEIVDLYDSDDGAMVQ